LGRRAKYPSPEKAVEDWFERRTKFREWVLKGTPIPEKLIQLAEMVEGEPA